MVYNSVGSAKSVAKNAEKPDGNAVLRVIYRSKIERFFPKKA